MLPAAVILAGCGGQSASKPPAAWQTVTGAGLRFEAPAGWKVTRAKGRISATKGSELVQVATFRLQKPYDAKLFARVEPELRLRMQQIAAQTGGELGTGRTVTADGMRAHAYDVTAGSRVDEYTFVLAGTREYLLLCRRRSAEARDVCAQLVKSFALS